MENATSRTSQSFALTSAKILEQTLRRVAPLPSQQSYAKALAAIFAMHIHRNELMDDGFSPDELPAASAIVVAPTGQGKTFLIRKMAQYLDINVITIDCSTLVAEGFKGAALSERLAGAREAAKDQSTFARSIIFLDEADKLAERAENTVSGGGMTSLLQLFNNSPITLPPVQGKSETVDTSRFTVLLGGAFEGLATIIQERLCPRQPIGFASEERRKPMSSAELLQQTTPEDLVKFGMMRELVGRIGTILSIAPMKEEDYRLLLNADSGSVRNRYLNYLTNLFGVGFEMTESCVDYLSRQCMAAKTGARAATPLVDRWMRDAVAQVEQDDEICKVILDAGEDGCVVHYARGPRSYAYRNPARTAAAENLPWHTIKARDTAKLTQKLVRYYRNSGGHEEFVPQLEAYLACTLKYLCEKVRPTERTMDSLEKIARCTRRNNGRSSFDIIMKDARYVHTPEYMAFEKEYNAWMQQNLVSALRDIMVYLQRMHGICRVKFELIETRNYTQA